MMLSDEEHFNIILNAIRDYQEGTNDIAILLIEKSVIQLKHYKEQTDTQEIYDEIVEIFNFYNLFVKEKKIDLPIVTDGYYDLALMYLNEAQEQLMESQK